jgi:hypothetical protein
MRGKDSQDDAIAVAKIYKISREVAAVAVEDQKSVTSSRFVFREALKDLFKLCQTYVIITPSRG